MENRLSMLILDDMSINRSLLRNIFDDDYTIYEGGNGQDALKILKEKEIDIILLDFVMPVMDGMTLLKILRETEEYSKIPVIVNTVMDSTESEIMALNLGADEFITKPYNPQIIKRRVSNIASKYIIERKEIRQNLKNVSERLQMLAETLPGGIATFEIGRELTCLHMNDGLYRMLGYVREEKKELFRKDFFRLIYEEDQILFKNAFSTETGKAGKKINLMFRMKKADGTLIWVGMDGKCMEVDAEVVRYYTILTDKTEEKKAMQHVEESMQQLLMIVEQDSLTGLYNRQTFYEKAKERIREDIKSEYVIAQWNMDQFKVVNVLYGSSVGDKALIRCAETIQSLIHEYGFCGRLEADRFVSLFRKSDLDGRLHEIESLLAEGIQLEEMDHPILMHVGFYVVTDRSIPIDVMCDFANLAMQEVKKNYLKRWEFFNEELRVNMMNEQMLVNEMEQALKTHQFVINLQPVYDANSFEIVSAEALVRWKHPIQGMISPGIFIPLFEKNGFIAKLDMYVWEEVCRILSKNRASGRKVVPVSVNVSRINFYNADLSIEIQKMVNRYNLDFSLLKFEITESAYTENPYQLMKVIEELRHMGFLILMDDFGSGYSSLNILKDVPVDILKIDMKFLDHLENSPKATNILYSVVRMAKSLDMKIIVEGVETQNQFEMLRSMGCNFIQGYYFSRPLEVEEFQRKLERNAEEKIEPVENGRQTVLVVDDIEINRASICAMISDEYNVIEAEDGEQAWLCIRDNPLRVNMVITDIMMPNLDGFGLMQRIRSNSLYDQIPIMVLTAMNEPKNEKKAILLGAQDVITRPFDPLILAQRMKNLLRLSDAENIQVEMRSMKENYEQGMHQRRVLDERMAAMACIKVEHRENTKKETKLLYANDLYCEIHEVGEKDDGENVILYFYRKVRKEDRDRIYQYLLNIQGNKVIQDIYTMDRNDGTQITIMISASFFYDDRGISYCDIIEIPLDISYLFIQDKVLGRMVDEVLSNLHLNYWKYDMRHDTFVYHSANYESNLKPVYIENASQRILERPEYEKADYDRVRGMYRRLNEGEPKVEEVFRVRSLNHTTGEKEYGWVRIVYCNFYDTDKQPTVAIGVAANISSEIELQQVKRQELRYKSILSKGVWFFADINLKSGKFVLERDGRKQRERENEKACKGRITFDMALQKYVAGFVHPDDQQKCIAVLNCGNMRKLFMEGTKEIQMEFRSRAALGGKDFEWFMVAVFMTEYEEDHHINANMQVRNIQSEHHKMQIIQKQAEKDIMTGCYNRATFEKKINRICAERPESLAAFIMIDADNFKDVNDTFGHDTGDAVLKTMAAQLMQTFRKQDLIGRLGGDEFAVFISDVQEKEAICNKARDICKRIYMPLEKEGKKVIISCSVGLAFKKNTNFSELYVCADQAQYKAKRSGKNSFELYQE